MANEELGAGLAYAGQVMNTAGNLAAANLSNKAQMKLAQYSFEQQRQMIREQNEYNSPVNQVARYKEAGLNPNLIYGQIGGGNQSEIAKYEAPRLNVPDVSGVGNIGEAIQLFLQEKKQAAEIKAIDAQTERYREETRGLILRNNWESFLSGVPTDNSFAGTRRLLQYDLGLRGQEVTNQFTVARTAYQGLKSKEQLYFNRYLLPLTYKLKALEYEKLGYETAKSKIDSILWNDLRNSEIMSNPLRAASHLGVLFGRSEIGSAFRDKLMEIARDPIGWKNSPIHWGIQQGKKLYNKLKKR